MEWDTVGVKALDDYTLEYTLTNPVPYFLSMTTYVCFMPAYGPFLAEKGEGLVLPPATIPCCNGAYYLSEFKPQESRSIPKAPPTGTKTRYIQQIEMKYNKEAAAISADLHRRARSPATIDNQLAQEWLSNPKLPIKFALCATLASIPISHALNFNPSFMKITSPKTGSLP